MKFLAARRTLTAVTLRQNYLLYVLSKTTFPRGLIGVVVNVYSESDQHEDQGQHSEYPCLKNIAFESQVIQSTSTYPNVPTTFREKPFDTKNAKITASTCSYAT